MEVHVLLEVGEDSFEGIRGVGNIQVRISEVGKQVGKIPFHAVVGAPNSSVCVVPTPRHCIDSSFLQELSPLVFPESQPLSELRFIDNGKISHE